jgi:hypothetical protein
VGEAVSVGLGVGVSVKVEVGETVRVMVEVIVDVAGSRVRVGGVVGRGRVGEGVGSGSGAEINARVSRNKSPRMTIPITAIRSAGGKDIAGVGRLTGASPVYPNAVSSFLKFSAYSPAAKLI